jgi:hypothetical protein
VPIDSLFSRVYGTGKTHNFKDEFKNPAMG